MHYFPTLSKQQIIGYLFPNSPFKMSSFTVEHSAKKGTPHITRLYSSLGPPTFVECFLPIQDSVNITAFTIQSMSRE